MPLPSLNQDILYLICQSLCYHCCQGPDVFPNGDDVDAKENKKTLASICRVSKACDAIARPVLYHYYATGNLIFDQPPRWLAASGARGRVQDDKLECLARTLVDKPELGRHIKALQFVCGHRPLKNSSKKREAEAYVLRRASRWVRPCLDRRLGQKCSVPMDIFDQPRRTLTELVIALSPRIEVLALASDICCWTPIPNCSRILMPNLKRLLIRGVDNNLDCPMTRRPGDLLRPLFKAAPNLEKVFLMNATEKGSPVGMAMLYGFFCEEEDIEDSPDTPGMLSAETHPKLREVAYAGYDDHQLDILLRGATQVETLRCIWQSHNLLEYKPADNWPLAPLGSHLEASLRRLEISVDGGPCADSISWPVLSRYTALEELHISQLAPLEPFDQPQNSLAEKVMGLIESIPSSIKHLRWVGSSEEAIALLETLHVESSMRFPFLEHISVGCYTEDANLDGCKKAWATYEAQNGVGFTVSWGDQAIPAFNPLALIPGSMNKKDANPLVSDDMDCGRQTDRSKGGDTFKHTDFLVPCAMV